MPYGPGASYAENIAAAKVFANSGYRGAYMGKAAGKINYKYAILPVLTGRPLEPYRVVNVAHDREVYRGTKDECKQYIKDRKTIMRLGKGLKGIR